MTDFLTSVALDEKRATSAGFLDAVEAACRQTAPLLSFLARAAGAGLVSAAASLGRRRRRPRRPRRGWPSPTR